MITKILNLYRKTFWKSEKYARFLGVKIGKNCAIATKSFGSEPYLIEIGNHVQITNEVKFFNHGGGWIFRSKYPDFDYFGKIVIGNNVYIGNRVLILPGVEIGNNVIIGAGSVVTKSISDNMIVAGNPARLVGSVDELLVKISKYNLNSKKLNYEDKKKFLLNLGDDKFLKKAYIN